MQREREYRFSRTSYGLGDSDNGKEYPEKGYFYRGAGLFLKQAVAVTVIIGLGVLINRSNFEFGKNCVAALGRAVRHELDWQALWNGFAGRIDGIWRIFSEVF